MMTRIAFVFIYSLLFTALIIAFSEVYLFKAQHLDIFRDNIRELSQVLDL
ncbi:hypothetical protein WP7S18C02_42310 [Klebsiella sp. WP7-S18-CRE-02]|nr:hypothetical protein WP3W18E02_44070 [Klebsiella sp. WP3-W18-ESBL-02]BBR22861.1 hypothetical protein WP3S18E05_43410 [Klebsiella sp. WP3-S18-ESBL-05]BBS93616.1 hypothetical protein WP7S18C02_42310 [Klebsiella sp. WP7-S18-CRE-02]BBS98645.1 hypothetical protein WP7S18C03_42380 [Klebsiella sp. WP7-S18-CRE-03]BBT03712.1 hypothetical protein WP7S18E04_42740 [Klebsiella sp. WP7-S18-ESBL-04]BBT72943.1 hypothetical protein WP8S18E06_42420 [Klebsiella sp. WP8-S18-ESBL-06]